MEGPVRETKCFTPKALVALANLQSIVFHKFVPGALYFWLYGCT